MVSLTSVVPAVRFGNQTSQLEESYKAGMFIAALGARGIAPPSLHTKGYRQVNIHIHVTSPKVSCIFIRYPKNHEHRFPPLFACVLESSGGRLAYSGGLLMKARSLPRC